MNQTKMGKRNRKGNTVYYTYTYINVLNVTCRPIGIDTPYE